MEGNNGALGAPSMAPDAVASLLSLARRLERSLNSALAEDGIRLDQWRILHTLSSSPGALMGELAESLGIPSPSVTRLVDELADRGLVFRRPAPEDRRKAGVYLSRLGYDALSRASAIVSAQSWDETRAMELITSLRS